MAIPHEGRLHKYSLCKYLRAKHTPAELRRRGDQSGLANSQKGRAGAVHQHSSQLQGDQAHGSRSKGVSLAQGARPTAFCGWKDCWDTLRGPVFPRLLMSQSLKMLPTEANLVEKQRLPTATILRSSSIPTAVWSDCRAKPQSSKFESPDSEQTLISD